MLRLLISLLLALPGAGQAADAVDLALEEPVTRAINGGEIHRYRVAPGTAFARVHLVKRGIDLELLVSDSRGNALYRIADWRGREGWLSALLAQDVDREFLLEVSAVSETAPAGKYVISLDLLPATGTDAMLRIDAERTMALADHERYSHYLGTGGNRAQALEFFKAAHGLWRRIEFPREEARSLFSIAGIQMELGKMADAHQTFRDSLELWRKVGDQQGIAASLNHLGLIDRDLGLNDEALDHLYEARANRETLGDTYFLARIANNIGLIYLSMGKSRIAMKYLTQALEAYQAGAELRVPNTTLRQQAYFDAQLKMMSKNGDVHTAAIVLNNLAWVHSRLGELEDALNYFENYRFLSEYFGQREDVALATLNIGQTYYQMSEYQKALDHLFRALDFFAGPEGTPYWHSLALDNLGKVHLQIGNDQRALDFFERALLLRTREDNPKGRADTLQRLGEAYAALGEPGRAITYFRQSLELRQVAIDRYREALTLDQIGMAQARVGLFHDALASHQKALAIHRAAGNKRGETESLVNLGRFYASQNQPAKAVEHLTEALDIVRKLGERFWETQALFELAKVEMGLGRTEESFARLDEALVAIESLRGDLISPELRASFFATQLNVHRFYIDGLMNLARNGNLASSEAAFDIAERARQRTLLDYLANTGTVASSTDMALLKHREVLRRNLDADQQERLFFSNKTEQAGQLAVIDARIRDTTAELERLEITISGRRAPEQGFAGNTIPVAQLAALLGANTVLLEYALGEERSYVWVIGENVFEFAVLPPEQEIENLVRTLFTGLRTNIRSDVRSERSQLEQLGKLLLGPVMGHLDEKRLAVVPDGVLHYLPFAALGDPRAGASQGELVITNEIVVLPSASALLGLRNRTSSDGTPGYRIAVMADPVFTADDPRVKLSNSVAMSTRDNGHSRPGAGLAQMIFPRLPGTRYEAETIQSLAGPDKTLVLTGFAANRKTLLDGSLDGYNILHLATHGTVDPMHPGLSGVVLSALDGEGRKQPPYVRALDLFYMHLGARLVVLSACETALGKEIRGEGLMGMTHGFFYAGATSVIASLWQVPDRATAELMENFYREMIQNGHSPSAALRLAQLEIRSKSMWRDPYYWAAFTVQGDWK